MRQPQVERGQPRRKKMRPPLLLTILVTAYGDPIVYHVRNVLDGVEPIWVRSQQDDAAQALFTAVAKNNLLRRPPIEEGQTSAWYFFKETDKSFSRLLGRTDSRSERRAEPDESCGLWHAGRAAVGSLCRIPDGGRIVSERNAVPGVCCVFRCG